MLKQNMRFISCMPIDVQACFFFSCWQRFILIEYKWFWIEIFVLAFLLSVFLFIIPLEKHALHLLFNPISMQKFFLLWNENLRFILSSCFYWIVVNFFVNNSKSLWNLKSVFVNSLQFGFSFDFRWDSIGRNNFDAY